MTVFLASHIIKLRHPDDGNFLYSRNGASHSSLQISSVHQCQIQVVLSDTKLGDYSSINARTIPPNFLNAFNTIHPTTATVLPDSTTIAANDVKYRSASKTAFMRIGFSLNDCDYTELANRTPAGRSGSAVAEEDFKFGLK